MPGRRAAVVLASVLLAALVLAWPDRAAKTEEPTAAFTPAEVPDAAETARRRAELDAAISRHGADSARLLGPLVRLGYALLEESRYGEAEAVFRRQLAIAEARYPATHIENAHPLCLSGLARAFFYAGNRTLLVSHWAVLSDAAVKITTRMLTEAAADPAIGRAEAHRRAMLALAADRDNPHYAHPMLWAPFVVVGEGGARQ